MIFEKKKKKRKKGRKEKEIEGEDLQSEDEMLLSIFRTFTVVMLVLYFDHARSR